MEGQDEIKLFRKIINSEEKAFETLFRRYYGPLCHYAHQFIQNQAEAEEIVQNLFANLWEKRNQLTIETSVKNYFFRSIKNQCLNYIQHHHIKNQYTQKIISEANSAQMEDFQLPEPGLLQKLEESIELLPEKRREIFRLSREEGLKYKEIARKLNISLKTVETQMGLAIKTLRENLKHFPIFLIFFPIFL